jgi:hypothetical protein
VNFAFTEFSEVHRLGARESGPGHPGSGPLGDYF